MTRHRRSALAGLLCLYAAAFCGGAPALADPDADRIHSNGKTALMLAAKQGDTERVVRLVRRGSDVNRPNHNGGTPIMYAASSGDARTVAALLRYGAQPDVPADNGWTALMIASAKGYVDIARTLLSHGAAPNRADVYSWTPLMRAAYENRPGVVAVLLDDPATRINQSGERGLTALHLAVARGNTQVAERLLAKGADPAIEDDAGRTAADLAGTNLKDL